MFFSLIIGLSHAQELPYIHERSAVSIPEKDDTSKPENVNAEQPKYLSRYKSKLFLSDPQFAMAHRLSSAGLTTIVGGTVVTGVSFTTALILALASWPEGDMASARTALGISGLGLLGVCAGATTSFVGSTLARHVLISRGETVPLTGVYVASAGALTTVGSFLAMNTEINDRGLSDSQSVVASLMLGAGLLAIPVGLATQQIINRVGYTQYVDGLSLSPTFTHDSMGARVQVQF